MKITLVNGMTLEGTQEQIVDAMKKLGMRGDALFYNSESKGLVLISTMDRRWLRNAIAKMYRDWVNTLSGSMSSADFLEVLKEGPTDPTLKAMIAELYHYPEGR